MVENPNIYLIWGVTTHISDPNSITDWAAAVYECPNVIVSATPHPNIQVSQEQIFMKF